MTAAALDRAVKENIALRCMLSAGCDANNDGHHTIVKSGKDEFCAECGQMSRNGKTKPWFTEERLERIIARLAKAPAS